VVLGELSIDHINVKNYAVPSGASGVIASIVITIALWFTVALLYRRYTSAASASRRNYNLLREKLN